MSRSGAVAGDGLLATGRESFEESGPAAFCPLPAVRRGPNPTVWLIALLASLVLGAVCRADDSAAERRRRIAKIANMSPAERKQLWRQQERFRDFEREEQERLQELHRQLENDPDADQLRRVLHAYYEWLESLPAETRAELRNLKPPERIKRIKQLRAEEAGRPKPRDMEGLLRWMKQFAADRGHQVELLQAASKEDKKRFFERGDNERAWWAMGILWEQVRPRHPAWIGWPGWTRRPKWLTDDELADLRNHLSDETRKRLEKMPADRQWEEISGWVERSAGPGFAGRAFRHGPPPKEVQEQLGQFFEELSAEEQERLLNLPPDEMQRELVQLYLRQFWPAPGPGRGGPRGAPPGGRDPRPEGSRGRPPDGRPGGPPDRLPGKAPERPPGEPLEMDPPPGPPPSDLGWAIRRQRDPKPQPRLFADSRTQPRSRHVAPTSRRFIQWHYVV